MIEVTLSKGGTKERTLPINQIRIHDLWHMVVEMEQSDDSAIRKQGELINEVWLIAHDLKRHIEETA